MMRLVVRLSDDRIVLDLTTTEWIMVNYLHTDGLSVTQLSLGCNVEYELSMSFYT